MIIFILSNIWKHGGVIIKNKNGGYEILNADKIPDSFLKGAQDNFNEIKDYLNSVEGMNAIDQTMWKMISGLLGNKNEKMNEFICNDEISLNLFFEYQADLAQNGWKDAYEDYRHYENNKTDKIKKEIYERAKAYFKNK